MGRKKLGEMLVETGLISAEDLERALQTQRQTGGPLGQVMVNLGLVKELDLVYVLSRQTHIPVASLENKTITQDVLDKVDGQFCLAHHLIPFHHEEVGNFLDVGMVEPLDVDTLDRLRVMTKANVRSHFITYSTLSRMLRKHYGLDFDWQKMRRESGQFRPPDELIQDKHARDFVETEEIPKTEPESVPIEPSRKERGDGPTTVPAAKPATQRRTTGETASVDPAQIPNERASAPSQTTPSKRFSTQSRSFARLSLRSNTIDPNAEASPAPGSPQPQPTGVQSDSASDQFIRESSTDLKALTYVLEEKVALLEEKLTRLSAQLERDEHVLRRVLGLLLDKKVCTQKELDLLLSD